jgi:hypothetical protein
MLDGKAYGSRLVGRAEADLTPRLRDPALLEAFAALGNSLQTIMRQIASGPDAKRPAGTVDSAGLVSE